MEPVVRCLPFELKEARAHVQGADRDQKLAELMKTFLEQSDPKMAWKAAKNRSYLVRAQLYPQVAKACIEAGEVKKAAKIADQILDKEPREEIYKKLIETLIERNQFGKAEKLFFEKVVVVESPFSRRVEETYVVLVCGALTLKMNEKALELFNKLRWDHQPLYFHRILMTLALRKKWEEGKFFIEALPNMGSTSNRIISQFNQSALLDNSQ
jgi:tetratricopeptide (TPR) repeat protein